MLNQSDFIWYDQGVYNAIMALDSKHDNAIPIFGGALSAYNHINCDKPDYGKFIRCLITAAKDAKFYRWHEGPIGAMRTFCRLCFIDPMLIELYIGMSLAEVAEAI